MKHKNLKSTILAACFSAAMLSCGDGAMGGDYEDYEEVSSSNAPSSSSIPSTRRNVDMDKSWAL